MTDHAEAAQKLAEIVERWKLNGDGARPSVTLGLLRQLSSAIASLVKERDALKIESSKHAYEADKAKQDRDTAERRSEDFWSGRVASAEARCARLEEALRLAQQYVHIGTVYLPNRDERERARNDFDRIEGVLATIKVAAAEARARQALEEQG